MFRLADNLRKGLRASGAQLFPWALGLALLAGLAALVAEQKPPAFNVHQKAFYLNQKDVDFVRPGLQVVLESASIDPQGVIQVQFKLTDPKGLPLDRLGVTTPGNVNTSFIAATIPAGATQYTSYTTRVQTSPITNQSATQAGSDSGGTYQQVADGEYTYTFKTKAPTGYDRTALHTIGVYSSRNLSEFDLGTQFADGVFHFVPDGSAVQNGRDIVRTESCNRCHDPLAMHGGSRRSVALCILCHTPQTTDPDTGNTVNFPVMIHKIHRGADLPSVIAGTPYQIIGFQQTVVDYSTVEFPADVRRCEVCHAQGPVGTPPTVAAQATNYLLKPNRAACGACHDNVNFATGENHVDLPQVSDNQCSTCHIPQGELEFDASIKGAHTIPNYSSSLPGVVFEILSVQNTAPGQSPTVTFTLKDKSGNPLLPSDLNFLELNLGGPTSDYASRVSEVATTATGSAGQYTYTFKAAIPQNAQGTFAVGIDGYRSVKLLPGTRKEVTARDTGVNQVFYFGVTDATPVPRRTVVAQANCEKCHEKLALHGGIRNRIENCVICHNATADDTPFRPANQLPTESIHFKTMIHKIHTGENLETDFTIIGFRGTVVKFNEVRYPGDRRDCGQCHVNNSEQLPLPDGLQASVQPRGWFSPQEPITAACLGCHTGKPEASHALLMTSTLGESCEVCHGQSADFSINKVHAR